MPLESKSKSYNLGQGLGHFILSPCICSLVEENRNLHPLGSIEKKAPIFTSWSPIMLIWLLKLGEMVISHRWYSLPLGQFLSLKLFPRDPPVSSPRLFCSRNQRVFLLFSVWTCMQFHFNEEPVKSQFCPWIMLCSSLPLQRPTSWSYVLPLFLWHPSERPQSILRKINSFRSLNVYRLHLKYLIFMNFDNQKCRWYSSCETVLKQWKLRPEEMK